MRTQHRIAAAVRMRLEMLQPYIVSWAQALSLQARSTADAHCNEQRVVTSQFLRRNRIMRRLR